ncbi:cationic amino acid transporter 3-like isoform X2 [Microplitis mediator]|uniref:cationic amino acid transporter 3-like isoform X2 n=2 Tax=Microplitis mediator TaxID=375433 RepID=UPI0025570F61|nr:cationic amino acid transporter 3-like isoform X2 [Microplitis mediator]
MTEIMKRRFLIVFLIIYSLSLGNALECYVCDNQEGNREKCLNSIMTCEHTEDACYTEIRWGSLPYWSEGAPKQYYVSKKCMSYDECDRQKRRNMKDCTYVWYQDWKCSDCCKGDRCNYYIFIMKIFGLGRVINAFTRKKLISSPSESGLARCLSTLDLTALGIGSTLGVGVYVLAGSVAKNLAGPAVVISFAIAAVASMFAGLCYAEFGARVPKAGSAYVYSYVTMGEFTAFLIGWTLILEYVIGSASVVRGLSTYVDALFNNSMRTAFQSAAHFENDHFSPYPDFFAFGITIAFSVALAFGAKESSLANNFFTLVNLGVVLFVVGAGSIKANVANWKIDTGCTKEPCGERGTGGFAPYGIAGIIKGAASCFYGFIGFDCVATAGEEAKDPKKSIPIAIVASLTVVFLAYFGVSAILTTVLPYYEQDPNAPFPHLFEVIGWDWAKWFVSIGAICGLCSSLLGAMFPLPRVIYAMASDGLIFKWMGKVSSRFHTPMMGTLSAGFLTGVLAAIFNLDQLVKMMSIGTLLAYSIVAACVLILRYEESEAYEKKVDRDPRTFRFIVTQLVNANNIQLATKLTSQIVSVLVFIYFILCFLITGLLTTFATELSEGRPWLIAILAILVILLIAILVFIYHQPVSGKKLTFSVPLVPFLPALSIIINVYLMMMLDVMTWIRFSIWMAIGLFIYFSYGVWNSIHRVKT